MSDEKPRIELNWVQAVAGPLAAVTSAVLLSTFGVAGTLIGAALGSLVLTTGNAVYSYYLHVTRERVANAQMAAALRVGLVQNRLRDASDSVTSEGPSPGAGALVDELGAADADLGRAQQELEEGDPDDAVPGWRSVLSGLPWKRVLLVSVGLFVAAMAIILAFELVTGRAVSSYTGGSDPDRRTSIPGLGGGAETDGEDPAPEEEPAAPTEEAPPAEQGDVVVPYDDATAPTSTPTPTESALEPTPTPTPATEPTPTTVEPQATVEGTPVPTP